MLFIDFSHSKSNVAVLICFNLLPPSINLYPDGRRSFHVHICATQESSIFYVCSLHNPFFFIIIHAFVDMSYIYVDTCY